MTMPVRVKLTDVWDEFQLDLPAGTSVAEVKRQVLELGRVKEDGSDYVIKYRGAQLVEEEKSLSDLGVVKNAALVMLLRRRRPVR
jgi:hypothetical protein